MAVRADAESGRILPEQCKAKDVASRVDVRRTIRQAHVRELRLAAAPDIPTIDEAGAPGVYISTWSGLWVPKGTPKEVIRKLTGAAMDSLADPAVRQRLADLGQVIPPREQQTAEALGAYHKAEIEKWWPIIKSGNVKADADR
jgi:tripartite-type tricarboxylate transporter receptor subunit TctC